MTTYEPNNEWVTAKYVVICPDPDVDAAEAAYPCDTLEEAQAQKAYNDDACPFPHYWRELH